MQGKPRWQFLDLLSHISEHGKRTNGMKVSQ